MCTILTCHILISKLEGFPGMTALREEMLKRYRQDMWLWVEGDAKIKCQSWDYTTTMIPLLRQPTPTPGSALGMAVVCIHHIYTRALRL